MMQEEIMFPHQIYSAAAAASASGARNVPGFQGLLPHHIMRIPPISDNPARTPQHGYVRVQQRNWFQEDETLILDIGTARRIVSVERDGGLPERRIVSVERDGGLPDSLILKCLKTRDCREVNNNGEPKICVVCQDDLCQENSRIGVLGCGHEYHASCIRQWLQQKNICPLCKATALPV
ncbi:putative E3 ubiquitin-protein ligase ZFP1 [Sesamum angolense]|uniref:RING-type E3 ubiquitin transferase n=1 Tax=Sesamum angolense TaxID=2727404 RepID=A0AAE1WJP6_9LAMI|nr:putative E3 ubiquitin-protein ligase ZFP1 [Sesamum angolense]